MSGIYRLRIDRDASIIRFENWGFTRTAWLVTAIFEFSRRFESTTVNWRYASYPLDFTRIHEIQCLELFHDWAQKLNLTAPFRRRPSFFNLTLWRLWSCSPLERLNSLVALTHLKFQRVVDGAMLRSAKDPPTWLYISPILRFRK